MVIVNYLAIMLPIGGKKTWEISESYSNLFAPAGYAFSIWGLIYALLAIYVIYQFKREKNEVVAKINYLFIANSLLNTTWIFAWHYNYIGLSVLLMGGLLFTLIRIADILRVSKLQTREKWLICLPFSVYFGWITVATIANITVFLVSIGWNRFGLSEIFWTVTILLVGAAIGSWRLLYDRFISYGLVLIWAYGAILYKHLATSGFDWKYPYIIVAVIICLIIFLGIISYLVYEQLLSKRNIK